MTMQSVPPEPMPTSGSTEPFYGDGGNRTHGRVPPKIAQTERQFQEAVIQYAELQGWLVYHTFDSRRSAAGFPDLVMVRGTRIVFAELKAENGRESKAQAKWSDALSMATSEVWLWRPSDWPEIEMVLRRFPELVPQMDPRYDPDLARAEAS